jgi:hypothetical protein
MTIVKINKVREAVILGKLIVANRYCVLYENGILVTMLLWTLPELFEFMKM